MILKKVVVNIKQIFYLPCVLTQVHLFPTVPAHKHTHRNKRVHTKKKSHKGTQKNKEEKGTTQGDIIERYTHLDLYAAAKVNI